MMKEHILSVFQHCSRHWINWCHLCNQHVNWVLYRSHFADVKTNTQAFRSFSNGRSLVSGSQLSVHWTSRLEKWSGLSWSGWTKSQYSVGRMGTGTTTETQTRPSMSTLLEDRIHGGAQWKPLDTKEKLAQPFAEGTMQKAAHASWRSTDWFQPVQIQNDPESFYSSLIKGLNSLSSPRST